MGVGGKEVEIERYAGDFWPYRTDGDRNARFDKLCHDMLYEARPACRHGASDTLRLLAGAAPLLRRRTGSAQGLGSWEKP